MRAVVQRVTEARVVVEEKTAGKIGMGLLVLLGVSVDDSKSDAEYLAEKIAHLRIFEDANGKMNLSLLDVGGEMLVVSQFTLLGDCAKGRRPSFIRAAGWDKGRVLYEYFSDLVKKKNIHTENGIFGAMMDVSLVNHGPVTLILESP